jgi:O-6-methylguanine DNA methyltransferase
MGKVAIPKAATSKRTRAAHTPAGGIHLFDTRIGPCGLAWTSAGIDCVQLPEQDPAATLERLRERAPDREACRRPPADVREAARRIAAHLRGRLDTLGNVKLDLTGCSPFAQDVYRSLRRVRPGRTVTYADLARLAGNPGGVRAVGRTMGANPVPLLVPCHRVVTAGGALGGFSAYGGSRTKAWLLFNEGVVLDPQADAAMRRLRQSDPVLRRIIDRVGPLAMWDAEPSHPYEALVESIIYQQLAGGAAAAIARRVRALTPGPAYPSPAEMVRLSEKRLRSAGLSGQKLSYLRDLARHVHTGQLKLGGLRRLDDDAVVEELTRVRGIGRWSAEMFLIFHLRRHDVLPVGDYGLQAAVKETYGLKELPRPAQLEALGECWRPYRSWATGYLWRSRDQRS